MFAKVISSTHPNSANAVLIWEDGQGLGQYLQKDGTFPQGRPHGSQILKPKSKREAIGLLKKYYNCPNKPNPDYRHDDLRFEGIARK